MRALQLDPNATIPTVGNIILVGEGADPADFDAVVSPNDEVGIGWIKVGDAWVRPPVVTSPAETRAALVAAVSAHVQATARARGYDSAEACASYATSTNATWRAEATAFVGWRDSVWTACHDALAALETGSETAPTPDALIAGLPVIEWPEAAA